MKFTQDFTITGVIAKETLDSIGLTSTEKEKKKLLGVFLQVSGYAKNKVVGYHEQTKVFTIYDTLIDVETAAFTENESKPGPRITYHEVGIELPIGQTFKVGIVCGATAKDLLGHYEYEIMGG
jgi:hypothetical protein